MTKPKPSYSTTNLQTPICTKLIACDGINLVGNARARGYCNKCMEAMAKKAAGPKVKPPRGENSALNTKTPRPLADGWDKEDD
jgi:hypothetical protein